jgi:glycosyltransferase involved in cell wall biosynthesis
VNLEVLVSTMNQKDLTLIRKMKLKSDALIINQTDYLEGDYKLSNVNDNNSNIRKITFLEKGLSKSRNRALKNAKGDICLIADDDVIYNEDYVDIITNAHKEFEQYDIIVFPVPSTNVERGKKYYRSVNKIGYLRSMKVYSYEITFKRNSVISKSIRFNESFGAGSGRYLMGEENIFLYECLKNGLKILYLPYEIGKVTHEESTWFKGYNDKYFIDKGACYSAMSHEFSWILALQFAFRRYKLYKNSYSLFKSIMKMFEGIKEYNSRQGYL